MMIDTEEVKKNIEAVGEAEKREHGTGERAEMLGRYLLMVQVGVSMLKDWFSVNGEMFGARHDVQVVNGALPYVEFYCKTRLQDQVDLVELLERRMARYNCPSCGKILHCTFGVAVRSEEEGRRGER